MTKEEPENKYLILYDGFSLQIDPILNEIQYSASGAMKYWSFQDYLSLVPRVIREIEKSIEMNNATGLQLKELCRLNFHNFLVNTRESKKK